MNTRLFVQVAVTNNSLIINEGSNNAIKTWYCVLLSMGEKHCKSTKLPLGTNIQFYRTRYSMVFMSAKNEDRYLMMQK